MYHVHRCTFKWTQRCREENHVRITDNKLYHYCYCAYINKNNDFFVLKFTDRGYDSRWLIAHVKIRVSNLNQKRMVGEASKTIRYLCRSRGISERTLHLLLNLPFIDYVSVCAQNPKTRLNIFTGQCAPRAMVTGSVLSITQRIQDGFHHQSTIRFNGKFLWFFFYYDFSRFFPILLKRVLFTIT